MSDWQPIAPKATASAAKVGLTLAFCATVPLANWLIQNVGTTCLDAGPCLVPVGFGLMAPSGVLVIGFALVLRDWLHEVAGRGVAALAVFLGVGLSFFLAPPSLAAASAVAFGLSEIADLAVYDRLRSKGRSIAVAISQVVGAGVDSAAFVYLAFGSFDLSAGNTLGKLYAGGAVALWLWMRERRK